WRRPVTTTTTATDPPKGESSGTPAHPPHPSLFLLPTLVPGLCTLWYGSHDDSHGATGSDVPKKKNEKRAYTWKASRFNPPSPSTPAGTNQRVLPGFAYLLVHSLPGNNSLLRRCAPLATSRAETERGGRAREAPTPLKYSFIFVVPELSQNDAPPVPSRRFRAACRHPGAREPGTFQPSCTSLPRGAGRLARRTNSGKSSLEYIEHYSKS
ncbi:unnamed protein product, partial [Ixodes persulcatus]